MSFHPDRNGSSSHDPTNNRRDDSSSVRRPLSRPVSLSSTTSLIPISTSTMPPENNNGPTSELAHERQTLLLMLLGQVCSLHDATPRTFVVHVVALYERGILDSHSIRFLFDLGLIPRGFGLSPSGSETMGGTFDNEGKRDPFCSSTNWCEECEDTTTSSCLGGDIDAERKAENDQAAIVPFSTPPLPETTNDGCYSQCYEKSSHGNNYHSMEMAHRQKEALAIRTHLELHEPLDTASSVIGNSSFSSANGIAGSASSTSPPPTTFSNSNRSKYSTTTFDNSSFRHSSDDVPKISSQLTTTHNMPSTTSWSVEHHPLSLSRYQREFHQLSLLATGSFGSVFKTLHRLEQRQYAVKCVTFTTMGYNANTLSLVMREVRCLAQLNHPNCVRYYTSWLEPSWMTGEQKESYQNDDELDVGEYVVHGNNDGGPKLLEEIERVIEGLHNTEINTSVDQFDSILYNDDDGFHWTSSPNISRSDIVVEECVQRPNYETNKYHTMHSHGDSIDGNDSDVSEWTRDFDCSGITEERSSFHNSQAKCYTRSESVELVRADESRPRRPYKKQTSYKYQISLYIQMQLCQSSTLADWIKHRNRNCIDFDAQSAFAICGQIVNGLSHVQ